MYEFTVLVIHIWCIGHVAKFIQERFLGFVNTNNFRPCSVRLSQPIQVVFFNMGCIIILPDSIQCFTEGISKHKKDMTSRSVQGYDFEGTERIP